jgi:adenylate cyclase
MAMEQESGIGKLLDLARADRKHLTTLDQLRRKITVMFTDIQGSTAYFEKHGDAAGLFMVHQCNSALQAIVVEHGGRVIKFIGDGMLAIFEECGKSIAAGIRMQHALQTIADSQPIGEKVAVRIGIHYEIGIVRTSDVFGDVVNVASRIESVAQANQIVISESLYEQVADLGFSIRKVGKFILKGKATERTLYEVVWNPDLVVDAPAVEGKGHRVSEGFRLQVLDEAGAVTAEHPLDKGLALGRTQGDLMFGDDAAMAPASLRISIEDNQAFAEDLSKGECSIFLRVAAGYTLQNDDIVLMGRQVLKFREVSGAMSAAAELGMDMLEVSRTLEQPVAELRSLHTPNSKGGRYPVSAEEVSFGRSRGTYTFAGDKLMSRAHARVVQRAEDFILQDLGSRNGTFVKLCARAPIAAGGMILVGNQVLRVVQ